ncbi:ankyrin repeat-containing protein [Ilyonectria robusta]
MLSFHLKRSDILQAKGCDKNLAGTLLKQGMDWINLRSAVREMAYKSRNFAHEYHKRHQETDSIKDLLDAIDNLSDGISKQISRLDEISKDLIQMVRALVTETHIYYFECITNMTWAASRNSTWYPSMRLGSRQACRQA